GGGSVGGEGRGGGQHRGLIGRIGDNRNCGARRCGRRRNPAAVFDAALNGPLVAAGIRFHIGRSRNERKEVIQCLIVIRRRRRPRPGSSPLARFAPPKGAGLVTPLSSSGTTMEGPFR